MKIIVDVKNMLYAVPKYRKQLALNYEKGLYELVRFLSEYQDWSANETVLVIDGEKREQFLMLQKNTTIIFSGSLKSADSIIEALVSKEPDRRKTLVVTSDRGVKDVIYGMGANAMTPEVFQRSIQNEIDEKKPGKFKF